MKLTRVLCLLVFLVAARSISAEPITDQNVRESVTKYMQAMRNSDFETMSGLMHPGDLEQFKELFIVIGKKADADNDFESLTAMFGIRSVKDLEQMPA